MRTLSATAHKYNSKNLKLIMRIRKEVLLQILLKSKMALNSAIVTKQTLKIKYKGNNTSIISMEMHETCF